MASPRALRATQDLFFPSISLTDQQAPECTICSERYDDSDEDLVPRNLSCGHSMCSKCIFRCMCLNGQPAETGTVISCPSKCSQPTLIPGGLIKNMPKNFAVLDIIQDTRERSSSIVSGTNTLNRGRSPSIGLPQNHSSQYISSSSLAVMSGSSPGSSGSVEEYNCDVCETRGATIVCPSCAVCLCMSCSEDIHSRKGYDLHQLIPVIEFTSFTDSLTSSVPSDTSDFSSERTCKHHTSEMMEYACETCLEDVCKVCVQSGEHKDHEARLLVDIATDKKEALRRAISEVDDCHTVWNKGFDDCHELQEYMYHKSRKLEADIKTRFHAVHSLLHAKEEGLLSVVRDEVDSRVKSLQKQADHLAKVCAIAKDLTNECERVLHHASAYEVVRDADKILAQTQQYVRSEQDTTPVVASAMDVDFSSEEDLIDLVDNMGELRVAPDRVCDLKVAYTMSSKSDVTLTWTPPLRSSAHKETLTYIVEHSSKLSDFKVIHEGQSCEHVLEDFQINEDSVHSFRVAAVNDTGKGPYSIPVRLTKTEASFLWDSNLKHPKARISNNGYSVSIRDNATWVSVGTNIVLSHGRHYWEVVLDHYGSASLSRKVVVGVVSSDYHHWRRSHGIIGIKTCPIGSRSWGLACGTAKKLSSGSTFFNSIGRKHNLFKEGDSVGVLLDLHKHTLSFYRNGEPLGIQFSDVYGPVIPAISFCRNKALTLRFPPPPSELQGDKTKALMLPENISGTPEQISPRGGKED